MALTNPYPFDNDAYQRSRISLNYHVREAWRGGASAEQIKSTIDEVFAEIEASDDGSIPATTEPDFVSDPPSGVAEEAEVKVAEEEKADETTTTDTPADETPPAEESTDTPANETPSV